MIREMLFLASAISLFSATQASAVALNGNTYFEVCLEGSPECSVGVVTKYGDFGVLIPEDREVPGMLLGDIWKIGPNGVKIARVRNADYQRLKDSGLERMEVNPENIQSEIDKIQGQIDDSLTDCLLASAACGGGGLLALGTGPLGLAVAGVVCWQSYRQCKALDKANVDLFTRRKALQDKLKEEAEKKNGEGGGGGNGSGGGGGGMPSTGGLSGWFVPGGSVGGGGGSVSASETPPGGGPPRGIIFN